MVDPTGRPRRSWPQRIVLAANVIVIVAALGTAVALSLTRSKAAEVPRTAFGTILDEQPSSGEPLNFLLVGIDSASNLPANSPVRVGRPEGTLLTDTLMILRLDPGSGSASLLSIPRDLWLTHAQSGQPERVNAAYALGGSTGAQNLVETIRTELDIPIHHYVMVDLNGFLGLIELLDGVTLYIEHPLRDTKAQLEISSTGCVELTPEQALGYVRSRGLQEFVDGEWQPVDDRNDLGRNERQQDFLVAAVRKAIAKGVRNPVTLRALVDDGLDIVTTLDDRLTPNDLLDLGEDFSDFRPETIQRYTLPVVPADIDGKAVLQLEVDKAQDALDIFHDEASAPTSAVSVSVRNGTGAVDVANDVADALAGLGFQISETGDADSYDYTETVIRFGSGRARSARLLARALEGPVVFERVDGEAPDVQLVIGADFAGVRATLAPRESAPDPTREAVEEGSEPTPSATAGAAPSIDELDPVSRCL